MTQESKGRDQKGFEKKRKVSSCLLIGKKIFLFDLLIPGVVASVLK